MKNHFILKNHPAPTTHSRNPCHKAIYHPHVHFLALHIIYAYYNPWIRSQNATALNPQLKKKP